MSTVDDLMRANFPPGRPLRSAEYRDGCRELLARKIDGTPLKHPYKSGSLQFDAYHAGIDEGHAIYRDHVERRAARSISNG